MAGQQLQIVAVPGDGKVELLDRRLGRDRHEHAFAGRQQHLGVMFREQLQVLIAGGGIAHQVQVVGVGEIRRAERRDAQARRRERAQRSVLGDADEETVAARRAVQCDDPVRL